MCTDMTLNELAELTGFVDASHVLKVFSAAPGVTPKGTAKYTRAPTTCSKSAKKA